MEEDLHEIVGGLRFEDPGRLVLQSRYWNHGSWARSGEDRKPSHSCWMMGANLLARASTLALGPSSVLEVGLVLVPEIGSLESFHCRISASEAHAAGTCT